MDRKGGRGPFPPSRPTAAEDLRPFPCSRLIAAEDLRRNDVLCGRGNKFQRFAGNAAFRSIISSRKADYMKTRKTCVKQGIVAAVLEEIRGLKPPGRFLRLALPEELAEAKKEKGTTLGDGDHWKEVSRAVAVEKVKMSLRQLGKDDDPVYKISTRKRKKRGSDGTLPNASANASEQRRSSNKRPLPDQEGRLQELMNRGHRVVSSTKFGREQQLQRFPPPPPQPQHLTSGAANAPPPLLAQQLFEQQLFEQRQDHRHFQLQLQIQREQEQLHLQLLQQRQHQHRHQQQQQLQMEMRLNGRIPPSILPPPSLYSPSALGTLGTPPLYLPSSTASGPSASAQEVPPAVDLSNLARPGAPLSGQPKRDFAEVAKIALATATLLRQSHGANGVTGDRIRRDLVSLGDMLYNIITETKPSKTPVESDSTSGVRDEYFVLLQMGVPTPLCIIITNLLDSECGTSTDRFLTAEEVEDELKLIVESPSKYLSSVRVEEEEAPLKLFTRNPRLYDREDEIKTLTAMIDRISTTSPSPEIGLISGYAGTGKSSLADKIREPLRKQEGRFIGGKFDELGVVSPLSIIFNAFEEYCVETITGNPIVLANTRASVNLVLGTNARILYDLIPSLPQLLGDHSQDSGRRNKSEGIEALNRIVFYFRALVRALTISSSPLVIFLDDLQWADDSTLQLMTMLLSDTESTSLLILGCYRENEIGADHVLSKQLAIIETMNVQVTHIKLENLMEHSINAMLSDALQLCPRVTESLASIVWSKTGGNPLFSRQFVVSLCDERLLKFSKLLQRWTWSAVAVESKELATDVIDLMTKKMQSLDEATQWILKVASCLGPKCEEAMLINLLPSPDRDQMVIILLLDLVVKTGLLRRVKSSYAFSHDKIKEAAYSLISPDMRGFIHLDIGRRLWKSAPSPHALDKIIFTVVDQISRGAELIVDKKEKMGVAELCLSAGQKAMATSTFALAVRYLTQGIALLENSDWEKDDNDLCLTMCSCCAEAQYVIGHFDGAAETVEIVFSKCKLLAQTMYAHYIKIRVLEAQGKYEASLKHGFGVLGKMGETFPQDLRPKDVFEEHRQITKILHETPDTKILASWHVMNDPLSFAKVKIMSALVRIAYATNQTLVGPLVRRKFRLTIKHGMCDYSPQILAIVGSGMCVRGQFEDAKRCANLALTLMERYSSEEIVARVHMLVYSTIKVVIEPQQSVLPRLLHGAEVGKAVSESDWTVCMNAYIAVATQCGQNLDKLEQEVRSSFKQMKSTNSFTSQALPFSQAVLNLTGSPSKPYELNGDLMQQDEYLSICLKSKASTSAATLYLVRMWLAYMFGNYELASEMAMKRRDLNKNLLFPTLTAPNVAFYTGLTAYATMTAKGEGEGDWKEIATESILKLKTFSKGSAWNFDHKVCFLNAEDAALKGERDVATKAYEDAIRLAGEHNFIHDQALACERAARFHSETDICASKKYWEEAKSHYLEWGATSKVTDVEQILEGKGRASPVTLTCARVDSPS